MNETKRLRGRIAEAGIRRQDIAAQMVYSETMFSLFINGRRPALEGFEERVLAVLDKLERAERAAQEARERVLAEGDNDGRERVAETEESL